MIYKASSPGVLKIHGEHSVCYGKSAISMAIDKRVHVMLKSIKNDEKGIPRVKFCINTIKLNACVPFSLLLQLGEHLDAVIKKVRLDNYNESYHLADKCLHLSEIPNPKYVRKIFMITGLYLYKIFTNHLDTSIYIEMNSDIPNSGGLGSSGAFCCALAAVMLKFCKPDDTKMREPSSINKIAYLGESIAHGCLISGIDNTTSVYGGVVKYESMSSKQFLQLEASILAQFPKFWIIDSKIKKITQDVLDQVKKTDNSNIFSIIEKLSHDTWDFFNLKDASFSHFEKRIRQNQSLLSKIGVSNDTIDKIVNICDKHGYASKISGAGCGGVVLVVRNEKIKHDNFMNEIINEGFPIYCVQLESTGIKLEI